MTEYVVELYLARLDAECLDIAADQARTAAEELSAEGINIRYTASIFVPEDETCFHVYEAGSVDEVREASRRAGISVTRIVEAVHVQRATQESTRKRRRG